MFSVCVRDHFMIAHSFRGDVFGPAQQLHGATYLVDVEFKREQLDPDGIVVDIGRAGQALHAILADLNFRNLDDHGAFKGKNMPAIAEVQLAMARAAETVSGQSGDELKRRLRTGTIVTTDDRNWELRYSRSALRFSLSRAVAIDMESATIAAQGFRFRVPYGTLLCVSDKPLHGELKLPGQANRFYERAISEHMRIGIEACEQLRLEGDRLHSRKLRAFDEPPFR